MNKDIKYTSKDFNSLNQQLVNFAKTYFPYTYNDFSPQAIGTMFMEMSAAIGDIINFYNDYNFSETNILYSKENKNLYNLSYTMGYKPKVTTPANVILDVFQIVPATLSGSVYIPDFNYSVIVPENTKISSNLNNIPSFITQEKVDFSFSSSFSPTEISVYQVSGNIPQTFLLKKQTKAISANIVTITESFGEVERYPQININDLNIIGIVDIIDSDSNKWYEVPYLAQETIYESEKNNNTYNEAYNDASVVPYVLKPKKVQRRFVTRFTSRDNLRIEFGAGNVSTIDEEIVPNLENIGLGLPQGVNNMTTAFSPVNFMFTKNYGIAPSNTTLTIRYLVGGGVQSNIPSNVLNVIDKSGIKFNINNITNPDIINSVSVNNPKAAFGGGDGDDIEDIRLNALNSFQSQLRTISKDDYKIRALSLPSIYGTVSKIYVEPHKLNKNTDDSNILDMYVLSYDNNKNLTYASDTLKNNLINYLNAEYQGLNFKKINVIDAFIINIGIEFEIISIPSYNSNEVLIKCIDKLKEIFNIDKWDINQPIYLRDLYLELDKIQGVQTVKNIKIVNLSGEPSYSKYIYDTEGATINNIVYPSMDPCIFEVKNLNSDIKGRISNY